MRGKDCAKETETLCKKSYGAASLWQVAQLGFPKYIINPILIPNGILSGWFVPYAKLSLMMAQKPSKDVFLELFVIISWCRETRTSHCTNKYIIVHDTNEEE